MYSLYYESLKLSFKLLYMTTFKEISLEDYKKLLDNKQHTFAKTFKNIELLQKFKEKNYIDDIIDEEKQIKKKINILKN